MLKRHENDGKENAALNTMNDGKKQQQRSEEKRRRRKKQPYAKRIYISERRGKQLRAIRMVKLFHFVTRSLHIAFVIR